MAFPIVALPMLTKLLPLLGGATSTAGAATKAGGALAKLMKSVPMDSVLGGAKGVGQMISGARSRRAADNFQPAQYDPQQLAWLAEIQQKRRSINSGSAYAADMAAIDATTAGTNQAIAGAAGGDVGGTIQGLLAASQAANRSKNNVLAQGQNQMYQYTAFGSQMQNLISQRALEVDLAQQAQQRAQWAQSQQDAFGNTTNAAARINWSDLLQRHNNVQTPLDMGGEAAVENPASPGSSFDPTQLPTTEGAARQIKPLRTNLLSLIPQNELIDPEVQTF